MSCKCIFYVGNVQFYAALVIKTNEKIGFTGTAKL